MLGNFCFERQLSLLWKTITLNGTSIPGCVLQFLWRVSSLAADTYIEHVFVSSSTVPVIFIGVLKPPTDTKVSQGPDRGVWWLCSISGLHQNRSQSCDRCARAIMIVTESLSFMEFSMTDLESCRKIASLGAGSSMRGTLEIWGVAVLRIFFMRWKKSQPACCGDLKPSDVRFLHFKVCGVRWNEIICGIPVSIYFGLANSATLQLFSFIFQWKSLSKNDPKASVE